MPRPGSEPTNNATHPMRVHIRDQLGQLAQPVGRPPNGEVGRHGRPTPLPANAIGRPNVNVSGCAVNKPPATPPGQAPVARPGGAAGAAAGVVFQRDPGPQTARVAGKLVQFNADTSWARVTVTAE
jgi:hypothetical protein